MGQATQKIAYKNQPAWRRRPQNQQMNRVRVRYYDPGLGRFVSADWYFIEAPERCVESPLECGLYNYAKNNPVKFVDPTGEFVLSLGWGVEGKAGIGAGMERGSALGIDTRSDVPFTERFSFGTYETASAKLGTNVSASATGNFAFTLGADHVSDLEGESAGGKVSVDWGLSGELEASAGKSGTATFKVGLGTGIGLVPVEAEVSLSTTSVQTDSKKYGTSNHSSSSSSAFSRNVTASETKDFFEQGPNLDFLNSTNTSTESEWRE